MKFQDPMRIEVFINGKKAMVTSYNIQQTAHHNPIYTMDRLHPVEYMNYSYTTELNIRAIAVIDPEEPTPPDQVMKDILKK